MAGIQVKFFVAQTLDELEDKVNEFLRKLDENINSVSVSYSINESTEFPHFCCVTFRKRS